MEESVKIIKRAGSNKSKQGGKNLEKKLSKQARQLDTSEYIAGVGGIHRCVPCMPAMCTCNFKIVNFSNKIYF